MLKRVTVYYSEVFAKPSRKTQGVMQLKDSWNHLMAQDGAWKSLA